MSDKEKELQGEGKSFKETITVPDHSTSQEGDDGARAPEESEPAGKRETKKVTVDNTQDGPEAEEKSENREVIDLRRYLETLTKEKEEIFQSYIRLKADFDNFRRRTKEELSQARERGLEDIVTKLLPVLDNLERAIDSSGDPDKWREGVEMVFRQFLGLLETEGVTTIPSIGESFDPNKHEVIAKECSESPENVIIEELRKGYQLREKTIRPSLVKVSAGEE